MADAHARQYPRVPRLLVCPLLDMMEKADRMPSYKELWNMAFINRFSCSKEKLILYGYYALWKVHEFHIEQCSFKENFLN